MAQAAWITLSSLLSAGLGMLFWLLAARLMTPEKLGLQTAILSITFGPAMILAPGIGDALMSMLPPLRHRAGFLVRHAYRMVLVLVLPAAVLAALAAVLLLKGLRGSVEGALVVFAGVLLWSFFVVQDAALIAMRKAWYLPIENGLVGLAKLALLPLFAGLFLSATLAALLPALLAVLIVTPIVRRRSREQAHQHQAALENWAGEVNPLVMMDDTRLRRRMSGLTVRTMGAVALSLGVVTLLPFIVTASAGQAQGAVFSLCLSVASVLDFISIGVGSSVVLHAAEEPERAAEYVREALLRTVAVVTVGTVVIVASAQWVLRLFGASYVQLRGAEVLIVLAITSLLRTVYLIWSSLLQARQNLAPLLLVNALAAGSIFALVAIRGSQVGAVGAAWALLAVQAGLSAVAVTHLLLLRRGGMLPVLAGAG